MNTMPVIPTGAAKEQCYSMGYKHVATAASGQKQIHHHLHADTRNVRQLMVHMPS
jgi:hypothetical protein